MFKTPLSLQKCCANFICDNLAAYCAEQPIPAEDPQQRKLVFRDPGTQFNTDLSELLLVTLGEKGKLNDETLSLFNPDVTSLCRVVIHNSRDYNSQVYNQALYILQGHRIVHFEVIDTFFEDGDFTKCLGEWSLSNLRVLDIRGSTFPFEWLCNWIPPISKLKTLHTLKVGYTDFSQEGLEIITGNLLHLTILDISCTGVHDLSPLRKCKHRLKSLSLFGLLFRTHSDPVGVVCELYALVQLDVSRRLDMIRALQRLQFDAECFPVANFLSRREANPSLVSLDMSGAAEVDPYVLQSFLEAHPDLIFLGLTHTSMAEFDIFQPQSAWYKSRPELKVSGDHSAVQIMQSLRKYILSRPRWDHVNHSLEVLFELLQVDNQCVELREDIIETLLRVMKTYFRTTIYHPPILAAASACLANIANDITDPQEIHPILLSMCVDVSVTILKRNSPLEHMELHKYALATIWNLMDMTGFDWLPCTKVVMKCMLDYASLHPTVDHWSAGVCSVLLGKLTREEVAFLATDGDNLSKLLYILRSESIRFDNGSLVHLLEPIWNFTDECMQSCRIFVIEGGVELFMIVLRLIVGYETDMYVTIRQTCLGVLGNIAESDELRYKVMKDDIIKFIQILLHSEPLILSFLAAHVLAQTCLENEDSWAKHGCLDRSGALEDLMIMVRSWNKRNRLHVTYRSFRPFYRLLQTKEAAVQLYALWAIQALCTDNGERYLKILDKERGYDYIRTLMMSSYLDPRVKDMCWKLFEMRENHTWTARTS